MHELSNIRMAVLIPSYRPHLHSLARLVNATVHLANDIHRVAMHALLSTDEEVSDFRDRFQAEARVLRFMAFPDVLWQVAGLTVQQLVRPDLNGSASDWPACRKYRGWTADRQTSGLKKLVGLRVLYNRGYTHAWVLDSDSMPLRPFSFEPMFSEFAARPRLLTLNMSHPAVIEVGSGLFEFFDCASKALQLKHIPALAYFFMGTDYWMYVLRDVAAMMKHIERRSLQPFPLMYMRYPGCEYVYYGLYVHHLAPVGRRHHAIILPDALLNDPLTAAVWQPVRWRQFGGLWCASVDVSFEQQLRVLDGSLFSWIHGYRFDHKFVPPRCHENAGALVQRSAAVTWATSNIDDMVLQSLDSVIWAAGSNLSYRKWTDFLHMEQCGANLVVSPKPPIYSPHKEKSASRCKANQTFGCFMHRREPVLWTYNGCHGLFRCDGEEQIRCGWPYRKPSAVRLCKCSVHASYNFVNVVVT